MEYHLGKHKWRTSIRGEQQQYGGARGTLKKQEQQMRSRVMEQQRGGVGTKDMEEQHKRTTMQGNNKWGATWGNSKWRATMWRNSNREQQSKWGAMQGSSKRGATQGSNKQRTTTWSNKQGIATSKNNKQGATWGSNKWGIARLGNNNVHKSKPKALKKKTNLQIINLNYKPCKTKPKKKD